MDLKASPSTKSYAANKGVDLVALARSTGRTTLGREDVDAHLGGNTAMAAAPNHSRYWEVDHAAHGPVTEEPMPRMAKIAAANLSAAGALIPQVTHHERADMTAVDALRKAWRAEAQARGLKLTALAFHVMALARCLTEFPRFNASLSADGETLILKNYVHIGIAVDTPHGLMVPVLRHVDRKGLWELSAEISELAARAQARKIGPEEMGGASMSISNLGGIGGIGFTPIVNPPELAILGITRTETITVWDNDTPRAVQMVPLDLSYDHRVINGADAARFLARFTSLLSTPERMML
ncbi:2-oxo acid dehydrogenase subunit E2 [Roseibaca sp. Y0-43]|uniref:2-oxo acid dehydrogenase subunit E2 n=1 Tax=Roseibaca sp. Y0-43 TaxID=2816854 RepID=UPI001D0BFA49|nr:2-oxo acid dehydrogenase subunit E2 [Roseibaca sp. Y0-43]